MEDSVERSKSKGPECDFIFRSRTEWVFRYDLFFFCNNDHSGLWGYNACEPDGEKPGSFGSCLGTNLSGGAGGSSGGIAFK